MMGVKLFLKPSFIMHLQLATFLSFQFAQLAFNSKELLFCMVFPIKFTLFIFSIVDGISFLFVETEEHLFDSIGI